MTDERITEDYVYEYWDCPRCDRKAIRGDFRNCAGCGYSRDDTITFYRKETDELVGDEEQIEEFKKGPDWVCSYCASMISQSTGKCSSCGVERDDSVKNYFDIQEKKEQEQVKYNTGQAPAEDKKEDEAADSGGSIKKLFIIGGVITAVIAGAFFWATSTSDVEYNVKSVVWERAIPIERYQWTNNTDWKDEIRGDDVKVVRENREIRRYEKRQIGEKTEKYTETEKYKSGTREECKTTYKSTGSGASKRVKKCRDVAVYKTRDVTKTRQVPLYKEFPIYGTKVTYKSKLYTVFRPIKKSGNNNNPQWPKVVLGKGLDGKPDRAGQKTEKNEIVITKVSKKDKGPKRANFITRDDLLKKKYILNRKVKMKINNLGSIKYEKGEREIKADK